MKKVLVTGATGFIGNYVIEELLRLQYTVIATATNIEKAQSCKWFNNVTFIPFSLDNFNKEINYVKFFNEPDLIIHLAWQGLPNYKSLFHFEENLPSHYALLKNLIVNGLTDVTITGTCFEYGMQEGCLSEETPAMPENPYALAKDTLRKFLQQLQKSHPFSLKWIRLFYMYGVGQNPASLLSQLTKSLENGEQEFNMSGGEQERDYLPIEKVAENIVTIGLQNEVTGIINCCSGKPIKIRKFVEDYLMASGRNIKIKYGVYPYPDYEPMSFWGDNSKLKSIGKI